MMLNKIVVCNQWSVVGRLIYPDPDQMLAPSFGRPLRPFRHPVILGTRGGLKSTKHSAPPGFPLRFVSEIKARHRRRHHGQGLPHGSCVVDVPSQRPRWEVKGEVKARHRRRHHGQELPHGTGIVDVRSQRPRCTDVARSVRSAHGRTE